MENDILSKIFELCGYSLESLLIENTILGKEVTGILINSNQMTIYTGGGFGEENKVTNLVEGSDIIPTQLIDEFISYYPRINISTIIEDGEEELSYVLGLVERENKEEIIEPTDVLGTNIKVMKKRVYITEGKASAKDNRPEIDKLAQYQAASMFDFAVYILQTKGYREGMYRMSDLAVYGYNDETNDYTKLGTRPNEVSKQEYVKDLDFRAVGYNALRIDDGSDMHFIKCPSVKQINITEDLKKALNSKTGIVVLDSLMAVDLINSDFINEDSTKSIWYAGLNPSKRNHNTFVTSLENKSKESSMKKLHSMSYNMIIDDIGLFTAEEVVSLSQTTLVVLGKEIKDVKIFCSLIGLEGKEVYERFIENIVYMGSLYKGVGLKIGETSKHLLKTKDFYSFGEVLDDNKTINSLLRTLTKEDIIQVSLRGGRAIVVTEDNIEKRVDMGKPITDKQIINFLWKVTEPAEHETMIDLLNKEGNFTTIYCQSKSDNRRDMLVKINVFKSGTGLNMRADELVMPKYDPRKKEITEGVIRILEGSRGVGKTYRLKQESQRSVQGKRVLIIDRDFDFDAREYGYTKEITVIRDKDSLTDNLIKSFNPEVMIINSPVTGEELFEFIENMKCSAKIFIGTTYDIMDEMKNTFEDSPSKLKICKEIEKRVSKEVLKVRK